VGHELAQVNVARMRAPLDSPELASFVAATDPVLRLAHDSDGFIWRHADAHGPNVTEALRRLAVRRSRPSGPSTN
jgi:hypothetical protein